MEMSPQAIRSTGFRTVKKGYDPTEVDAFKDQVASVVESAQNQATAMEARARAAVAKLQEVSQQVGAGREERPAVAAGSEPAVVPSSSGDTEVISRTLLLAQRTADATVAEARAEADSLLTNARDEAGRVLDSARAMAAKTVEDARADARRSADDERVRADNEVQALLARRDFLLSDVDHLEQYIVAQRERLRDAAVQIQELVERVPGGLGDMRRPLLSASADPFPGIAEPGGFAAEPPEASSLASFVVSEAAGPDDESLPDPGDSPAPTAPGAQHDSSPRLDASTLAADPSATESVWRLLDEEVANTQAAQASFEGLSADVTAEVPAVPPRRDDRSFRIGGEELR